MTQADSAMPDRQHATRHTSSSWAGFLAAADWRASVLLGLVGTLVVAVGTLFRGRLARTADVRPLVVLQHTPGASATGQELLFGGLLITTIAWWWLGRAVRGRADGPRLVAAAAFVWSVPLTVTPPAFSWDLWSYVANAVIAARGLSPYHVTPMALSGPIVGAVSARWRDSPAPYGPVPLVWGGTVGRLTSSPWLILVSFRVLALIGLLLLAFAVPRLARLAGRDPASASWLAVASPFTIVHGVASAHVDILLAGLLACSVLVALQRHWVAAAALMGLAAAVKVPALLAVVPAALAWATVSSGRGLRTRLRAVALVGGVAVAVLFILGPISGLGNGWITALNTPLSGLSRLAPTTQVGLLLNHVTGQHLVSTAHALGAAAITVVAAIVVWRGPADTIAGAVRGGALVMSVAVLLSPVEHLWYFFWALPLLAAAPMGTGPRRALVSLTASFALLAPLDASQHLPAKFVMVLWLLLALVAGTQPRRTGAQLVAVVRRHRL